MSTTDRTPDRTPGPAQQTDLGRVAGAAAIALLSPLASGATQVRPVRVWAPASLSLTGFGMARPLLIDVTGDITLLAEAEPGPYQLGNTLATELAATSPQDVSGPLLGPVYALTIDTDGDIAGLSPAQFDLLAASGHRHIAIQ